MFADRTATAMVPAADLPRATAWYAEKLGLKPKSTLEEDGASYELADGFRFFIYKTAFAGTARHTILTFNSPDVRGDMARMRGLGVVFEDYDLPGLKTVDGVAEWGSVRTAWFKDSEGNIIGLTEGM